MKICAALILAAAAVAFAQPEQPQVCKPGTHLAYDSKKHTWNCEPAVCVPGFYLSLGGECMEDLTGKTSSAGDGCNTAICSDPACRSSVVTAMACSHPDDPAVPAFGTSGTLSVITSSPIPISIVLFDKDGKQVMTCNEIDDTLSNCRLAQGVDLAEAMQSMYKAYADAMANIDALQRSKEDLRQYCLGALTSERMRIRKIRSDIKTVQKSDCALQHGHWDAKPNTCK